MGLYKALGFRVTGASARIQGQLCRCRKWDICIIYMGRIHDPDIIRRVEKGSYRGSTAIYRDSHVGTNYIAGYIGVV